jgi:hypothetical protein
MAKLGLLHVLLRRFCRDQSGTLTAEAVIVMPILLWAYLALFVYWDAFKTVNTVQKAAYTVSDLISRETDTDKEPLTPAYITGMRDLMQYLIADKQVVGLRVSSVTYSAVRKRIEVDWSVSPDGVLPELTNANIASVEANIPIMADGDHSIIFESEVPYYTSFNIGIGDTVIKQFVVTRPRFVNKICMSGFPCG